MADREVELIQLDMNQGIGQDGKGILLTTFDVAGTPLELRLLPGVPDKYAGKKTNSYVAQEANLYEHDMFYMPVNAPAGGTWLSYDLGAYTTNLKHPDFYPLAKDRLTHLSTGSLYQWGRDSDGHELRENPTSTNPKYGTTATISTRAIPGHSQVITGKTTYDTWFDMDNVRSEENDLYNITGNSFLWGKTNSVQQPCPAGYNIVKVEHLIRNDMRSDEGRNQTGTPWVDSYHRDNNIYGVSNGEYYNWAFFERFGLEFKEQHNYRETGANFVRTYTLDGILACGDAILIPASTPTNAIYLCNRPSFAPLLKKAIRYEYRESRDLFAGPAWYLKTDIKNGDIDRVPVRCVKE